MSGVTETARVRLCLVCSICLSLKMTFLFFPASQTDSVRYFPQYVYYFDFHIMLEYILCFSGFTSKL